MHGMADESRMSRTAPLFRMDPGWLFTMAGLAIMIASALLPAERNLHELKQQLSAIELRESMNAKRLEAYSRFTIDLEARNGSLLRRLAASQLNLMPEGDEPLLMATSIEHTVSDWIEDTVVPGDYQPEAAPDTLLTRLADGPRRLWLMGGGADFVFLGLIMGLAVTPRPSDAHVTADLSHWHQSIVAQRETIVAERLENQDFAQPAESGKQEMFQWADPPLPFEPAASESLETLDNGTAIAWTESGDDVKAWLRSHGSD